MKFGVGQSISRLEDKNLIIGKGKYTDDHLSGKGLHIVFLRSDQAHAEIIKLNVEDAKNIDGVVLVATQNDLDIDNVGDIHCSQYVTNRDNSEVPKITKPPMARKTVKNVGEIICFVVAETKEIALDAIEMVIVEYKPLKSVCSISDAIKSDAPKIYDCYPNNIVFDWETGLTELTKKFFNDANYNDDKIVEIEVINNRVVANSIETRPMVCFEEKGVIKLYCPTQGPVKLSEEISNSLKLEKSKFQIITQDVGGGFGFKIFTYPEQICIVWATKKIGKLIRWHQERSESFISDLHGRDNLSKARAVISPKGKIKAIDVEVHANMGSWLSNMSIFIPTHSACRTLTGPYDIKVANMRVKGVITNTPAIDAYRGAGRPEANYLLERLIDKIAYDLNIDRIEIRRLNLIRAEQIPYEMVKGGVVDSGNMPDLLEQAIIKSDWKGFVSRKKNSEKNGKFRGIGLAMYLEACGGGADGGVKIKFSSDGKVNIYAAQQDNGQGHRTTLTQIFSNILGYDVELINIIQGDSFKTPRGVTGGAKMTAVLGSTVFEASNLILKKAFEHVENYFDVSMENIEFNEGIFKTNISNKTIQIEELVTLIANDNEDHPLNISHQYQTNGYSYTYGCHIVEIEIDKETFLPIIKKYTIVDDHGNVINPLTLEGQIHGGLAQGIGQALYEFVYFDENGQLLTGSLMDYVVPKASQLPDFNFFSHNTPCLNNVLGVKGVGEVGAIGAPPAVISSISNALGIVHIDMPATIQKIWESHKNKDF